jgi:hypothetical protein
MPDEVILDVTTIEENVTVETTAGDVVEIQVVAPAGPAGATGPAGPNSVTSATTSDYTAELNLAQVNTGVLVVTDGVTIETLDYNFGTGSAQALKDALEIASADISDATSDGDANKEKVLKTDSQGSLTVTNSFGVNASFGSSLVVGDGDSVNGRYDIFNNSSHLQWYSDSALYGEREFVITTQNLTSSGSWFYKYPAASGTFAVTESTTGVPDKLTDGTIAGTLTLNSTSYTYGTGAAAAHRTALGLTTLATTTPAANVATFLETPTSANLAAAVTGETGSGALVFGTSPTLTTPTIAAINGGTAANDDITIQGTTNATRTTSYVNLQPNGGFVGIGTATPANPLTVTFDSSNSGLSAVQSTNTNSAGKSIFTAINNNGVTFSMGVFGSTFGAGLANTALLGSSAGLVLASNAEVSSGGSSSITFRTGGFGTAQERVVIDSTGTVGIGTTTPSAKAILDVTSTTKGFLPPRMTTTQRNAITSVPAGLMVYNTTTNKLNFYNGSAWEAVTSL